MKQSQPNICAVEKQHHKGSDSSLCLVLTHQNEFSMWIGLICLLVISEALL